jgi:hypothetical protein
MAGPRRELAKLRARRAQAGRVAFGMPEEIEIDTDKLRETIDDEIEKSGGRMLRVTALITAILAAVTAVVSLRAGSTVNEALVMESEATQLQARASDQWAYYQAKGIKGAVAATAANAYAANSRSVPDSLLALTSRYANEQADIQREARKLEQERDTKVAEAADYLPSTIIMPTPWRCSRWRSRSARWPPSPAKPRCSCSPASPAPAESWSH